ncbi:hypothetical protein GCM10022220_60560 [Actinocatenispora rupis]
MIRRFRAGQATFCARGHVGGATGSRPRRVTRCGAFGTARYDTPRRFGHLVCGDRYRLAVRYREDTGTPTGQVRRYLPNATPGHGR